MLLHGMNNGVRWMMSIYLQGYPIVQKNEQVEQHFIL